MADDSPKITPTHFLFREFSDMSFDNMLCLKSDKIVSMGDKHMAMAQMIMCCCDA